MIYHYIIAKGVADNITLLSQLAEQNNHSNHERYKYHAMNMKLRDVLT